MQAHMLNGAAIACTRDKSGAERKSSKKARHFLSRISWQNFCKEREREMQSNKRLESLYELKVKRFICQSASSHRSIGERALKVILKHQASRL